MFSRFVIALLCIRGKLPALTNLLNILRFQCVSVVCIFHTKSMLWNSWTLDFADLNLVILLSLLLVNSVNARNGPAPSPVPSPTPSPSESSQPLDFKYIQLWADADGETHIAQCRMSGFREDAYSSLPQFVRDDFGGNTTKLIFTELSVGLTQPLHSPPAVQFVVTLSGSWYVSSPTLSHDKEFSYIHSLEPDWHSAPPSARVQ